MGLSLPQKGPVRPPPVLAGPVEATRLTIQSWPGVIAATHWNLYRRTEVDGADFYVGEEELGHLHLDGEVHLATTPELRHFLVAAGLARRFSYTGHPNEGWVEASVRTEREAEHAAWLFRLNYDRIRGLPMAELLNRIACERRKS